MPAVQAVGERMSLLYSLTIPGRPIVKKNTQRTVGRGRATRRISSPQFVEWESRAMAELLGQLKRKPREAITRECVAHFRFFFANRQSEADVSNLIEGPQDLLVKAGVLKDDRLIVCLSAWKYFGHEPCTQISIFDFEEINQTKGMG